MATMEQTEKDTSGRPRRKIVFTETGRALFEQCVSKFWTRQRTVRKKIEAEMKEMATDSRESYHRLINLAKERSSGRIVGLSGMLQYRGE